MKVIKLLIYLMLAIAVGAFYLFCVDFVIEMADELGNSDKNIIIYAISFTIIYYSIWLFVSYKIKLD